MKALDYGRSMYGGWYFNYVNGTSMQGIHANTLNELRSRCKQLGFELKNVRRVDH